MSKAKTASGAANFRIKVISAPIRAYIGRCAKTGGASAAEGRQFGLTHNP
jgi:hypothetical protein